MIILGCPIRHGFLKLIAIIFFIVIAISLMSCNKIDFDPTTSALKYIIKDNK